MNPECPICNDDLAANAYLVTIPCGHAFHEACLNQWLRRSMSCPQCRSITYPNYIRPLYLNFITNNDAATLEDLENRVTELQNILLIKETEIDECRAERKNLKTTVELQNNNFHEYLSRIAELETEKTELSSKLTSKIAEAAGLSEGLKENEKKISHLEKCVKDEKEAQKVFIELQKVQHDKLITEVTAKNAEIEELNRKLAARVAEKDAIARELTTICAQLEETKRKKEVKLEVKHESEVDLQEARAIKEEPTSFVKGESDKLEKKVGTSRKAKTVKKETVSSDELLPEKRDNEVAASRKPKAVKKEPLPSTENIPGRRKSGQEKQTNVQRTSRKPLATINPNRDEQEGEKKCGYFLRPR